MTSPDTPITWEKYDLGPDGLERWANEMLGPHLRLKRRLERGEITLAEFRERWKKLRGRILRGEPITRQATL